MNTRLLCLALFTAVPAALAQNVLTVLESSGPQVVRAASLGNALIEVNGKLVIAGGTQFGLRKAAAYRKGLIKFSQLAVRETRTEENTLVTFGNDFDAYLTSDTPLKHCFIVLEITIENEKGLYMSELKDLNPGEQHKIRISARSREHLDEKHYLLHVFSDGVELLNSTMSEDYIAQQAKKTDELLLKNRPDSPVRMARGTAPAVPVYPPGLLAQGVAGTAKVSCTIDAQGAVTAVDVVEATNPQFGESLAAAARQWKFEPAVKDHQYVAATAVIPYSFKLPAPAAK